MGSLLVQKGRKPLRGQFTVCANGLPFPLAIRARSQPVINWDSFGACHSPTTKTQMVSGCLSLSQCLSISLSLFPLSVPPSPSSSSFPLSIYPASLLSSPLPPSSPLLIHHHACSFVPRVSFFPHLPPASCPAEETPWPGARWLLEPC